MPIDEALPVLHELGHGAEGVVNLDLVVVGGSRFSRHGKAGHVVSCRADIFALFPRLK